MTDMVATNKNKIVEVLAYAREVSIRHWAYKKYTKHSCIGNTTVDVEKGVYIK